MNQGYPLYAVIDPVDLDEKVHVCAVTGWQQGAGTVAWRPILCPLGISIGSPRARLADKGYSGIVIFWADLAGAQRCRGILEGDRREKRAERDRIRAESAEPAAGGASAA